MENLGIGGPWLAIFWALVGAVTIPGLCFILRQVFGPPSQPITDPGALEPKPESPHTVPASQLEAVEGIGADIAAHLRAKGILSFDDLAGCDLDALKRDLKGDPDLRLAYPVSWPLQAKLLAAGRIEEFLRLAVALNAGVPRLEDIDGIGDAIGDRLRGGNIASVAKLSGADRAEVAKIAGVPMATASRWISQAARFDKGDEVALLALAHIQRLDALPIARPAANENDTGDGQQSPSAGPAATSATNVADNSTPLWNVLGNPAKCAPCLAAPFLLLLTLLLLTRLITIPPCPTCPYHPPCHKPPPPPPSCAFSTVLNAEDLFFGSGSAQLTQQGQDRLKTVAHQVGAHASRAGEAPGALVILGHTDRMPLRRPGGNQKLSEDRAGAVADFLRDQLKWPQDIVFDVGMGSRRPAPGKSTARLCRSIRSRTALVDCLEPDRRVEIHAYYHDEKGPESITP